MAAGDANTTDFSLPLVTLLHMLTIKLSSSNYMLWRNQLAVPSLQIPLTLHGRRLTKETLFFFNPLFLKKRWLRLLVLNLIAKYGVLLRQLIAMIFSRLLDISLMTLTRHIGFSVVSGSSFENFLKTQRAVKPRANFRDLLSQAENHELFLSSVHGPSPPHAALVAYNTHGSSNTRGQSSNRGGFSGGHGRGHRPPHCQKDGRYSNVCPRIASFAQRTPSLDANLAQDFHSQCHVTNNSPDGMLTPGPPLT
ncbi:hypothetical protein Tco_0134769 [Tanacetum coccineum]